MKPFCHASRVSYMKKFTMSWEIQALIEVTVFLSTCLFPSSLSVFPFYFLNFFLFYSFLLLLFSYFLKFSFLFSFSFSPLFCFLFFFSFHFLFFYFTSSKRSTKCTFLLAFQWILWGMNSKRVHNHTHMYV